MVMRCLPYMVSVLLAGVVSAQTVHVTQQNIFDLVPDRDALTGLAGSQRIKASFWENNDYSEALNVEAALPIQLTIKSMVDDFQISVVNNVTSAPPNVVWWTIPSLNAGSYELTASAVFPDDAFLVFNRYLTLTNAPATPISVSLTGVTVSASVNITNTISSALNIYYWGTNVASITNSP